jgi:hypothetical protein
MNFDLLLLGTFLAVFTLFTLVFLLQRARYKYRKRRGKKHLGFYPSTVLLSLTLLGLQTIAQPDLIYALEQRQTEAAEDNDEGDPDDPAAKLNRQLKRIRNGEPIDTLKVPLCKRS